MIEINLLPEELRQTEGTPLPRLVAILGSVVVACGLGVLVSFYYMVYIPRVNDDIKITKNDIDGLKVQEADVTAKTEEINKLTNKVNTLNNLTDSRMRYGRLLDKLANTVVGLDGVWYKSFAISPDGGGGGAPGAASGKRYKITLSGTIIGENGAVTSAKFADLMANITTQFSIPKEEWKGKPGEQMPPNFGFSKELGARFYRPPSADFSDIGIGGIEPLPGAAPFTPEQIDKLKVPKQGLDFKFDMAFEMPPPKQVGP